MKMEKKTETLYNEMKQAVIDLIDGQTWYELRDATGLSEERCKELTELFGKVSKLTH